MAADTAALCPPRKFQGPLATAAAAAAAAAAFTASKALVPVTAWPALLLAASHSSQPWGREQVPPTPFQHSGQFQGRAHSARNKVHDTRLQGSSSRCLCMVNRPLAHACYAAPRMSPAAHTHSCTPAAWCGSALIQGIPQQHRRNPPAPTSTVAAQGKATRVLPPHTSTCTCSAARRTTPAHPPVPSAPKCHCSVTQRGTWS
jgi:hypothetical protein